MFGLIRRISYSVIPRPDRPWEDDPTSNAPNPRRKRRISSTAADEEQARKKKARGEDPENPGSEEPPSSPLVGATGTNEDTDVETDADTAGDTKDNSTIQREGSLGVKVVTKGVNEVELEDKATANKEKPAIAAASDEAPATSSSENVAESSKATGKPSASTANPESIPLPEENAGELDDIRSSSSPVPESAPPSIAHAREDSAATAVELPEAPAEAPKTHVNGTFDDGEIRASAETNSSRPGPPRQSRSSKSATYNKPPSAAKKLPRSKSPKKVSTRA